MSKQIILYTYLSEKDASIKANNIMKCFRNNDKITITKLINNFEAIDLRENPTRSYIQGPIKIYAKFNPKKSCTVIHIDYKNLVKIDN